MPIPADTLSFSAAIVAMIVKSGYGTVRMVRACSRREPAQKKPRATNKERPSMPADRSCPFLPCTKVCKDDKHWLNHVINHAECRIKNRPSALFV